MRIETDRLILRNYKMRDFVDYVHLMTQKKLASRAGFSIKTDSRLLRDLKEEVENNLKFAIVIKGTDLVIGEIGFKSLSTKTINLYGLTKDENVQELEFCLLEKFWNKGYMTEALEALVKVGFEKLSLDTIVGACYSKNLSSKKVQIKCGLIPYKTDPNHVWDETGETCKVILSKITKEQYKHIAKYKNLNIKLFNNKSFNKNKETIDNIIKSSADIKEL